MDGGIANPLIQLLLGLGAQDGFVGGTDGAEHPVQPAHCPFATLARSLMIEIVERKGNVGRYALQHRKYLAVDRPWFAPGDKEDTDAAAVAGPPAAAPPPHRPSAALGAVAPGQRARVVKKIVADDHLADRERPGRRRPIPRVYRPRSKCRYCRQTGDVVAASRGEAQEISAGLQQKKIADARKSPLKNAASLTLRYSSSGDFAYAGSLR